MNEDTITRGCTETCGDAIVVDHGVVTVRGADFRVLCKLSANGQRSVALEPVTRSEDQMPPPPPLSPREREVLGLVARGLTTTRIAKRLGMRPSTVRTHMEHVRDKLGVRTRAQAVAQALSMGELAGT
jgi:DNA-binding CsgD family transcriptional regulator